MLVIGKTYKLKPPELVSGIKDREWYDYNTGLIYPHGSDVIDQVKIIKRNTNGTFTFETQNGATLYVHPSWVFHNTLKEL